METGMQMVTDFNSSFTHNGYHAKGGHQSWSHDDSTKTRSWKCGIEGLTSSLSTQDYHSSAAQIYNSYNGSFAGDLKVEDDLLQSKNEGNNQDHYKTFDAGRCQGLCQGLFQDQAWNQDRFDLVDRYRSGKCSPEQAQYQDQHNVDVGMQNWVYNPGKGLPIIQGRHQSQGWGQDCQSYVTQKLNPGTTGDDDDGVYVYGDDDDVDNYDEDAGCLVIEEACQENDQDIQEKQDGMLYDATTAVDSIGETNGWMDEEPGALIIDIKPVSDNIVKIEPDDSSYNENLVDIKESDLTDELNLGEDVVEDFNTSNNKSSVMVKQETVWDLDEYERDNGLEKVNERRVIGTVTGIGYSDPWSDFINQKFAHTVSDNMSSDDEIRSDIVLLGTADGNTLSASDDSLCSTTQSSLYDVNCTEQNALFARCNSRLQQQVIQNDPLKHLEDLKMQLEDQQKDLHQRLENQVLIQVESLKKLQQDLQTTSSVTMQDRIIFQIKLQGVLLEQQRHLFTLSSIAQVKLSALLQLVSVDQNLQCQLFEQERLKLQKQQSAIVSQNLVAVGVGSGCREAKRSKREVVVKSTQSKHIKIDQSNQGEHSKMDLSKRIRPILPKTVVSSLGSVTQTINITPEMSLVNHTTGGLCAQDAGVHNESLILPTEPISMTNTASSSSSVSVTSASQAVDVLTTGTLSASTLSTGTLSASTFLTGTLSADSFSTSTVSAGTLSRGTLSPGISTPGTSSPSTLSTGTWPASTLSTGTLATGTFSSGTLSVGTLSQPLLPNMTSAIIPHCVASLGSLSSELVNATSVCSVPSQLQPQIYIQSHLLPMLQHFQQSQLPQSYVLTQSSSLQNHSSIQQQLQQLQIQQQQQTVQHKQDQQQQELSSQLQQQLQNVLQQQIQLGLKQQQLQQLNTQQLLFLPEQQPAMPQLTQVEHQRSEELEVSRRPSVYPRRNEKRNRTQFTEYQLHRLKEEYNRNILPSSDKKEELANELNLSYHVVHIYFQNRRRYAKLDEERQMKQSHDILAGL